LLELEAAEWKEKCQYLEMRKFNTDSTRGFHSRQGSREEIKVIDETTNL